MMPSQGEETGSEARPFRLADACAWRFPSRPLPWRKDIATIVKLPMKQRLIIAHRHDV